jgi:hypothetical protein
VETWRSLLMARKSSQAVPPAITDSPLRHRRPRHTLEPMDRRPSATLAAAPTAVGGAVDGTAASSVPSDAAWIKCFDDASGAYYYINAASEESVWVLPQQNADAVTGEDLDVISPSILFIVTTPPPPPPSL